MVHSFFGQMFHLFYFSWSNVHSYFCELFLSIPSEFSIHFSFNHRRKRKLKCALWFATKMMFKVFHLKCLNKAQLLKECIKEMDWTVLELAHPRIRAAADSTSPVSTPGISIQEETAASKTYRVEKGKFQSLE